jgi:glycosylphosphatidylinositol transamidase
MLQGPRADATEAIVLMAAWKNMDDVLNQSGVALALTLARYFNRQYCPCILQIIADIFIQGWSLWSKDIFFVITPDSTAGPQAWVDAYHSEHDPQTVQNLPIRGGALQGAIALDYPAGPNGHRFDKVHIVYDGINGQLPNLDLINTVTVIGTDYMGIGTTIQRMWKHDDSYEERLKTMLHGMLVQGLGHGSGPHSCFIPYHVDAITLQTVGDGWHDEMTLGRLVESTFRSLNNLLEHLHQSFFFYLLMHARRFVSIGTYLPSAMLIAVNFSIMSIALWVQSGRPRSAAARIVNVPAEEVAENDKQEEDVSILEHRGMVTAVPKSLLKTEERSLLFPMSFVLGAHFLGITPLYLIHGAASAVGFFQALKSTLLG